MTVHRGESVAPGVAVGTVYLRGFDEAEGYAPRIPSDQVEHELNRLREALVVSRSQIEEIKDAQREVLGEDELRIFDTHIGYLSDPMFVSEIEKLVLQERYSVRAAIHRVVENYDRIFQLVENERVRQRASDFRDVATRISRNLTSEGGGEMLPPPDPDARYVLAAAKLTTTDMFDLRNAAVEGIVAEEGGISSHAAILARSMGIPTITGIRNLPAQLENGDLVILDAGNGELHVRPDERLLAEYTQSAERWKSVRHEAPPQEAAHATRDGSEVSLLAACGNVGEVELARTFGMGGVGLFRTELMFMVDDRLPTEDMLVKQYSEVVKLPDQQRAMFRLLDVTAAARVSGLPRAEERNPALGLRGIRAHMADGAVMRLQLRAILRAAVGRETAGVLVPFVTAVQEIQRVKAAILEERLALRKAGVACAESLFVAPIIEVPAAAFVLKAFLDESSFVVVAVDDLQAHLLAADRDNAGVREHYEMMHPGLFEVLARLARDAAALDKELVLFGEGAADPIRLPFYLGTGVRSYAVAPVRVNGMLEILQRFSIDECQAIAKRVLEAPRALDVQRILVQLAEGRTFRKRRRR